MTSVTLNTLKCENLAKVYVYMKWKEEMLEKTLFSWQSTYNLIGKGQKHTTYLCFTVITSPVSLLSIGLKGLYFSSVPTFNEAII